MRFVLPYLLVVAILLAVVALTYSQVVHIVKEVETNANLNLLEQSKQVLDQQLSEMETKIRQIGLNSKITGFQTVETPFSGNNTYKLREIKRELADYSLSGPLTLDYLLVYRKSGIVLSSDQIHELDRFYGEFFRYDQLTAEQWIDQMTSTYNNKAYWPNRPAWHGGKTTGVVLYVQSLGFPIHSQAAIGVMLAADELAKLFQGIDLSDGGWAYIADDSGQVLLYLNRERKQDETFPPLELKKEVGIDRVTAGERSMYVSHTVSDKHRLSLVVAQPEHIFHKKVLFLKRIMYAIGIGSMLLCLLVAFLLIYRDTRSMQRLFHLLASYLSGQGKAAKGNIYYRIQNSVTSLIRSNEHLQSRLDAQIPVLRSSLIEKLLMGSYRSNKSLSYLLQYADFPMENTYYVVMIVHIRGYDSVQTLDPDVLNELRLKKAGIEHIIGQLKMYGCSHDIEEDKLAFLLYFGSDRSKEYIRSSVDAFHRELQKELYIRYEWRCNATAGKICRQAAEISRAFEEAMSALPGTGQTNDSLVWYEDLPASGITFYYPLDVELRIVNLTHAGDWENLDVLLKKLKEANLQTDIPYLMKRLFLQQVGFTLIKCTKQHLQIPLLNVENDNLHDMFDRLAEQFQRCCAEVTERNRNSNEKLIREMKHYIHETFPQPDLSLSAMGKRFHMSEAYLSLFFKEHFQVHFFEYVQSLRMEHAKRLLADTVLPVQTIAMKSGYHSLSTFSRAFKRHNGVSATDYRHMSGK